MYSFAINGLGRIGRTLLRAYFSSPSTELVLTRINTPAKAEDTAHLLKYDSVHGRFPGEIKAKADNMLIINGQEIILTHEKDLSKLSWQNIDLVMECTGKFNDKKLASEHINQGAKKVLVSAPCKNADSTIIYGVNQQSLKKEDKVVSVGSCTTNCLAPVAKIIHEKLGIINGFMTTIHAYTGDQNLIDGSHKDLRRARAANISMVPTSTGAAKTIGLVIPELDGKLDGAAVRVPTPNVSMIDFTFVTEKSFTVEELNGLFSQSAQQTMMKEILSVSDEELVSIDFNHTPYSAIIDLKETRVLGKNFGRVVAWYDNEYAFALRMLDVANLMKG